MNTQVGPEALVPFLAQRYGLSSSTRCSFIRRGGNDHYLVKDGARRYVLRLYLNGKYYIGSEDELRFELDLLDFLKARGLPVAAPIPDIDGHTLAQLDAGDEARYAALFEFAEGEGIGETMEARHPWELGSTVARLHLAMDRFTSEHARYHLDLDFLLEEPLRLLEARMVSQKRTVPAFLHELADDLRGKVGRVPIEGGAYGLVHCDLGWHNINHDPDSGMTLFDFDLCGYGWRAFDLALVRLQLDDRHWAAFLEAYDSARSMSDAERDSIADFVYLWPMWHIDLLRNRSPILQLGHRTIAEELDGWLDYLRGLVQRQSPT